MHPYLQPKATEIEERLAPVLRELGLRSRLTYIEGNPRFIFDAPRRKGMPQRFSPVAIDFLPKSETKLPEAPWVGAYIALGDWEMKPLGDTGWTHRRLWQSNNYRIWSFSDYVLDRVEEHIRERGIIKLDPPGQSGVVDSHTLADAVIEIGGAVSDLGVVRIPDDKGQSIEALTFQDSEWHRVHMTFPEYDRGTVLIDGDFAGSFVQSDAMRVYRIAARLATGRDPGVELTSRPQPGTPFGNR